MSTGRERKKGKIRFNPVGGDPARQMPRHKTMRIYLIVRKHITAQAYQ